MLSNRCTIRNTCKASTDGRVLLHFFLTGLDFVFKQTWFSLVVVLVFIFNPGQLEQSEAVSGT